MTVALLLGDYEQHLDHLAPLSALLHIPLYITEHSIFSLAQTYYPNVDLHYLPMDTFDAHIAKNCEAIISCHPKPILDAELFVARQASKKPIPTIWIPHGNSDKGAHSFYLESLQNETHALLYGEKIAHFLKEKQALDNLNHYRFIGNYRYTYFQLHQTPLTLPNPSILFAPSWQPEDKTHLLTQELKAIAKVEGFHILVKPHPNTFKLSDPELLQALIHIEDAPNMTLIKKMPSIYPLLASVDLLITDLSSMGYDYLVFDRPLILLHNPSKHHMSENRLDLNRAGYTLGHDELDQLEALIKNELAQPSFQAERQKLYNYTFASPPSGMDPKLWIDRQSADVRLSR